LQRQREDAVEQRGRVERKALALDRRWGAICAGGAAEALYLRELTEVLLYLVLPEPDFAAVSTRILCRVRFSSL
jgi:hypothetical protein